MPGASTETSRVKNLNANWIPGGAWRGSAIPDGTEGDGQFAIKIITEDDQEYVMPASPASMSALAALARADTVMAWDPVNRALIIANIVGTMPWTAGGAS